MPMVSCVLRESREYSAAVQGVCGMHGDSQARRGVSRSEVISFANTMHQKSHTM